MYDETLIWPRSYQSISVIAEFLNKAGFDSPRETIEASYKHVMQEALALLNNERERIKAAPKLCYLSKDFPNVHAMPFLSEPFEYSHTLCKFSLSLIECILNLNSPIAI